MLYLAEVLRKSGVIGRGKAELKLLASQRSENSWSAVPGEEVIPAPDDAGYGAGTLVMVEIGGNRQVQRHSEAGRQLVSILQNFSRLQEKFKTQEEEIEQWKESLIFQSQELNNRQAEVDAREEQLQQMEADFAQLEQQRQEIEASQEAAQRLREEYEKKSQELEGAWAQLNGQINQFEEKQSALQQTPGLDDAKAHQMQELLNRLSGAIAPTESVREQLNLSFEIINQQQGTLDQRYQTLEEQRHTAHQQQESIDHQTHSLQGRWQEWRQTQIELEQAKTTLATQQKTLETKQEYATTLAQQLQHQEVLQQQIAALSDGSGVAVKVDTTALEQMPLEELQTVVRDLENDLEKNARFVQGQEEELLLEQEEMNTLKQKIDQASEYDRLRLETELNDGQDRCRILNETLVGQRRNLQEKQAVLKRHQAVLARRQGMPSPDVADANTDLSPVLERLETLRGEVAQALKNAQTEVQDLQNSIEQTRGSVEQRHIEQDARWNELQQAVQALYDQKAQTGELWGKVNTSQEALQLAQNGVSGLKDKLEAIAGMMGQFQEASDHQLQAIAEMRQMILSLTQSSTPEFVAS